MKTTILLAAFVLLTAMNGLFAQHPQVYPIPSFNCFLTAQNTGFQEKKTHIAPSREKRDMDVTISSSSTTPMPIYATVYLVKDNGATTLGPFTAFDNETLSVPIDNGQWAVIINCDWDILASVWTNQVSN